MDQFRLFRYVSVVAASAASFVAMGFGSTSQPVGVVAEVPLLCRVSFDVGAGTFDANGLAKLGTTQEFCNSGSGYKVYARADGADAGAALLVDGRRFSLTGGGEFVIIDSSGPARMSRQVSLDAGTGDGGGRLSVRIEAQ